MPQCKKCAADVQVGRIIGIIEAPVDPKNPNGPMRAESVSGVSVDMLRQGDFVQCPGCQSEGSLEELFGIPNVKIIPEKKHEYLHGHYTGNKKMMKDPPDILCPGCVHDLVAQTIKEVTGCKYLYESMIEGAVRHAANKMKNKPSEKDIKAAVPYVGKALGWVFKEGDE